MLTIEQNTIFSKFYFYAPLMCKLIFKGFLHQSNNVISAYREETIRSTQLFTLCGTVNCVGYAAFRASNKWQ